MKADVLAELQVQKYLVRIGTYFNGPADSESLRRIHSAHLMRVPFENLSIHRGEKILLDKEKLFDKIILRKRGGFCYELNYLFRTLLLSLGYNAEMISAEVYNEAGVRGPEFDHMAILVNLENDEYLCDVGFGDSFIEPILFKINIEQMDRGRIFKISMNDHEFQLLRSDDDKKWIPLYDFTKNIRKIEEYNAMCTYHQSSPESTFTKRKICSAATPGGRITLTETKLIITEGKDKREISLGGEEEFNKYLKEYFNM